MLSGFPGRQVFAFPCSNLYHGLSTIKVNASETDAVLDVLSAQPSMAATTLQLEHIGCAVLGDISPRKREGWCQPNLGWNAPE